MAIATGTALAIGAGLGALKSMSAQQQADAERKRQAEVTRYSPWTGMTGHSVQDANFFGDVASGGASGAMLGQAAEGQAAQQDFQNKYLDKMPSVASASTPSMMSGAGGGNSPWNLGVASQSMGSAGAMNGMSQEDDMRKKMWPGFGYKFS